MRLADARSAVWSSARPVQPNGPFDPVELRMARSALAAVAVLAVPCVAVAALTAGRNGAIGAGVATAVVAGMFAMSGAMTSWAARLGTTVLMGAVLGGYLIRMVVYALLIVLLRPVEAVHGRSLAVTAAVLLVGALVWEVRLVSRVPGFFWVNAGGSAPTEPVVYTRDSGTSGAPAPSPLTERTRP